MQAVLVMFRSDGERRSFSLAKETTIIGRREDCDLRIPLGEVSRKHARFVKDDVLRLEDLGSSNGTYHNGQRIQEVVVEPGDTVQVGPVVFVVQIDGVPEDDALQPRGMAGAGTTHVEELGGLNPTAQSEVGDADVLQASDSAAAGVEGLEEVPENLDFTLDESQSGEGQIPIDFEEEPHHDQKA
ncbi:MAG TPA: FHA domain-containing protein [Tepidisphaeraceae bacterium]|jgi:pSer/pThr/pTyr-binding forkhead associated (FHA) protein